MNWLDIVFLIILGWSIYRGFTHGFVIAVASLGALILGVFGAIKFSGYTANLLSSRFELNAENINLIAFILTFVLIVILTHITAWAVDKLIKAVALGLFNRIAGALFCLIKNALIISVFLVIIQRINEKVTILPEKEMNNSILYKPLQVLAPAIYPYLRSEYEKLKEKYENPDEIFAAEK